MTEAIILDIDGTLSDPSHRREILDKEGELTDEDWDKFFGKVGGDDINWWCIDLARRYSDHHVIIVTGRRGSDQVIQDTLDWLGDHRVPFDEIHFRPEGDHRPDHIVKEEILEEDIGVPKDDIKFVVDDRKQVVDMWRSHDLTVLHCAEGDF